MNYILYKNPIELDTLYIVQYLYSRGINVRPRCCIERNWADETEGKLPSIHDNDNDLWYLGLENVAKYYEKVTGINDILNLAHQFKKENPNYRINN